MALRELLPKHPDIRSAFVEAVLDKVEGCGILVVPAPRLVPMLQNAGDHSLLSCWRCPSLIRFRAACRVLPFGRLRFVMAPTICYTAREMGYAVAMAPAKRAGKRSDKPE